MPSTAIQHFGEDLARSEALVDLAAQLPNISADEKRLRADVLRSAWMFAIGGMDAYFCDAYTDLLSAILIAKSRQPAIALPDWVQSVQLPVSTYLEARVRRANWRWRMASRALMEKENILSLGVVQSRFNRCFRANHKFYSDTVDDWILHPDSTSRVFGITTAGFTALNPGQRAARRQQHIRNMTGRFRTIIQRRHDCIHNCDRPKVAPQALDRAGTVRNVIRDVRFLVTRCDAHVEQEFGEWMRIDCGFSNATVASVGY